MDFAHSLSFLKKLSIWLYILFFGVHLFIQISSSLAPGFSHRYSPDSPLDDPASINRVPSLAEVKRKGTVYVVKIFIGYKWSEMYAAISTGSNFNWLLCEPCPKCYKPKQSMFKANLSTSYVKIDCDHSQSCSSLQEKKCDYYNKCEYTYRYNDGSYIIGILSKDKLGFSSPKTKLFSSSKTKPHDFIFGCTHETYGPFSANVIGTISLGRAPLALVSQLKYSIFSYCLPSRVETAGWLTFGKMYRAPGNGSAIVSLVDVDSNLYKVILMSITVEVADQPVIIMPPQGRLFSIETGTSLTYIDDGSMEQLSEALTNSIRYPAVEIRPPSYDLCFDISEEPEKPHMPGIKLYFNGGAVVRLSPPNIFLRVGNTMMCLSIVSNVRIRGEHNILGSDVQMGRQIVYDLQQNIVTFGTWNRC